MHKKKAYIYPISMRSNKGPYNPYLDNFMDSLSGDILFVSRGNPSNYGIIQLVKYINKVDYIFFHWIEDLPDRIAGEIQCMFLFILLAYSKIKGIKVIWVLHNKLSHERRRIYLKEFVIRVMSWFSNLIITHSSEGIVFLKKYNKNNIEKTVFLPHPVVLRECPNIPEKKYDIFIWGTMHPYKGISEFVSFCAKNPIASKLKILIAGVFTNDDYFNKVIMEKTENIEILNRFIDNNQLLKYTSMSKYVLFPYSGESVLSSGALMDSVGMAAKIIGPRKGAFADLGELGLISVFDSFSDILDIIEKIGKNNDKNVMEEMENLKSFAKDNSWPNFSRKINKYL